MGSIIPNNGSPSRANSPFLELKINRIAWEDTKAFFAWLQNVAYCTQSPSSENLKQLSCLALVCPSPFDRSADIANLCGALLKISQPGGYDSILAKNIIPVISRVKEKYNFATHYYS